MSADSIVPCYLRRVSAPAVGETAPDFDVTDTDGASIRVFPGNRLNLYIGWRQEFGNWHAGAAFNRFLQSSTIEGTEKLNDNVLDMALELKGGFGNLTALEEGPIGFPYLVELGYKRTLRGSGTPLHSQLSLSFETYY